MIAARTIFFMWKMQKSPEVVPAYKNYSLSKEKSRQMYSLIVEPVLITSWWRWPAWVSSFQIQIYLWPTVASWYLEVSLPFISLTKPPHLAQRMESGIMTVEATIYLNFEKRIFRIYVSLMFVFHLTRSRYPK